MPLRCLISFALRVAEGATTRRPTFIHAVAGPGTHYGPHWQAPVLVLAMVMVTVASLSILIIQINSIIFY